MRSLIMWNMVTLDGFFEGPTSWDLGWHDTAWGDELERLSIEQLRAADTLLFGRATYEGMAGYWPTAEGAEGDVAILMNGIPKVVFSRTLERADWNNTRLVKGPAEDEVARLKQQPGKDMLVFGSAGLCSTLMRHGLIDEYRLGVAPIVLGGGTPLFKPSPDRVKMTLLEAKPLRTGCVILRYRPARGQPMKFLCLGYYDPDRFDALSAVEQDAIARDCRPHDEALHKSGRLVAVASLEHRTAVTLRPRGGKTAVTDGPFTETKELIGSFFIVEATNLDEAVRVASLHPAAIVGEHVGFGIEVRPIETFEQV